MGQNTDSITSGQFVNELRSTLNHLYDPQYLRQSSLTGLLGLSGRFDTPSALQALLTQAIESLKPSASAPNRVHAQAIYDLLLYRYIQQVNQNEIASQMGISVRQLRRQQNLAIDALARRLWEDHKLNFKPGAAAPAAGTTPISSELDWLRKTSTQSATAICAALGEALPLIQPLADQRGVTIQLDCGPEKLIQVHPVAFQQILLTLLDIAIQRSSRNRVLLSTLTLDGKPGILIQTRLGRMYPGYEAAMQSAHNLVELSSGSLAVLERPLRDSDRGNEKSGQLSITATFELAQRIEVLVIDDNPEITIMMQRFAAETLYTVSGLDDPKQALETALRLRPGIIILDIMMPQIDGLQVLSRIRHHPETSHTPVIICSVLPQKDLAMSLGANGFLNKPFQRDAFLAALAQVTPGQD